MLFTQIIYKNKQKTFSILQYSTLKSTEYSITAGIQGLELSEQARRATDRRRLSRLQTIGELENIGELFSRYVIQVTVYPKAQPVTKVTLKNKNYIEASHRFLSFYHSISKLTKEL